MLVVLAIAGAVVLLSSERVSSHLDNQGRDELRIALTSNGFVPGEVQHAPGTFAIAVENSALSGEYTLRLKAEDGTVLNDFRVLKGSSAWTVTLQTGTYSLTETEHPQPTNDRCHKAKLSATWFGSNNHSSLTSRVIK